MYHNNLKSKAKLILANYANEMDVPTKSFYIWLCDAKTINDADKQMFIWCEFRNRAFDCGLI